MQLVGDVEPYELMKLRLLNAGHQALCLLRPPLRLPAASTKLLRTRSSAASAARLYGRGGDAHAPAGSGHRLGRLQAHAHRALLQPASPRHGRAAVRLESSDRIPKWVLPVIRWQLDAGGEVRRSAAIVASWARYAEGVDEQGGPIAVDDRMADTLVPRAQRQRTDPDAFVANRDVFGDLVDNARFMAAYRSTLESLQLSVALAATLVDITS